MEPSKRVKIEEKRRMCFALVIKAPNNVASAYEKGDTVFLPESHLNYDDVDLLRIDVERTNLRPEKSFFVTGKVPEIEDVVDEYAPEMLFIHRIRSENRMIYIFPDLEHTVVDRTYEKEKHHFDNFCYALDDCVDCMPSKFARDLFRACGDYEYRVANLTQDEVHELVTQKWNDADKVRESAGRFVLTCEFERKGVVADIMKGFDDVAVPRFVCVYDLSQDYVDRRWSSWIGDEQFIAERERRVKTIVDVVEPLVPALQKRKGCEEREDAKAEVDRAIEASGAHPSDVGVMRLYYGSGFECPKVKLARGTRTMTSDEYKTRKEASGAELVAVCDPTPYTSLDHMLDHVARSLYKEAQRRSRALCGLDPPYEPTKGLVQPFHENESSGLTFV